MGTKAAGSSSCGPWLRTLPSIRIPGRRSRPASRSSPMLSVLPSALEVLGEPPFNSFAMGSLSYLRFCGYNPSWFLRLTP